MAPTVLREGPYRLFFFSREEPRLHVHVAHPHGEAKIWLQPTVELATAIGMSETELATALALVKRHQTELINAWHTHFDR